MFPGIKPVSKFLITEILLVISVIASILFVPGDRLPVIAAIAVPAVVIISLLFDQWIYKIGSDDQKRWITNSNFLSPVLILVPLAMRAPSSSIQNIVFDLSAYAGCVIFISLYCSSRLTILSNLVKVTGKNLFFWSALIAVSGYTIIMGLQVTAKYLAFSIEWTDFSYEFAPIWQTFRNGFFRMINEVSEETTLLRYHWPLFYIFISPLSLLWTGPLPVLWIHTFFFSATAVAAGFLMYEYTRNKPLSFWFCAAVTLYLPLHLANLYDLHADPLAMPFILFSFLFAHRRQWKAFALCMLLAMLCKEYVALVYVGFGAWLFFKSPKAGCIVSASSFLFFVLVIKVFVPAFNQGSVPDVMIYNYGDMGGAKGLFGIALYILTHPGFLIDRLFRSGNIVAFISMLLPFLFLPLRSFPLILAGGLIVLKNALSGAGIELLVHRETLFVPFVIYALVITFSGKEKGLRFRVIAVSFALIITFMLQGHAFPSRGFWLEKEKYIISDYDRTCHEFLKSVPRDKTIMVSSHLSPVCMARDWYFLFPRFHENVKPEYIVVDTLEQLELDWLPRKEQTDSLKSLMENGAYSLVRREKGLFLFRKTDNQPK